MGDILKDFQDVIAEQKLEIDRLTVENRLLRVNSEAQRELNGKLRTELNSIYKSNAEILKAVDKDGSINAIE